MEFPTEPATKKQFSERHYYEQKIQNYEPLYSKPSLMEEITFRISVIKDIINDLKIESNKEIWRKDIAKLEEIKEAMSYVSMC